MRKKKNKLTQHILPINDLKEHTEETTCKCQPRVEHHNGNMIVIHNSYDGREIIEQVNSWINV